MLHKTRGIVLQSIEYSDSQRIVKIYTEQSGLQSFLIRIAAGKNGKNKNVFLQPLSQVEVVAQHRSKGTFGNIKEIGFFHAYQDIPFDVVKSSLVLFVNELLERCLKEEEANPPVFSFITHSLQLLDIKQKNIGNFHLLFMLQLCRYLGFFPQGNFSKQTPYFDLREGVFTAASRSPEYIVPSQIAEYISLLMNMRFEEDQHLPMNKVVRQQILEALLNYYTLHLSFSFPLKSPQILAEVLD